MSLDTKYGPTWCVLPWVHAASLTDGSTQLCCVAEGTSKVNLNKETLSEYWNSSYMKSARSKMLKGEKVAACRRCYEEEDNQYRSHRMMENKAWQDIIGSEKIDQIVSATYSDGQLDSNILSVDLRLGNTCNLQCIMCQPRESSKWTSLATKIKDSVESSELKSEWRYKSDIQVSQYEWYKNEAFWQSLREMIPHLREIIIAGGEPMIIKQHLKFLKDCAENFDVSHIQLRYHTNLMDLPEEMIPYWGKFKKVEFFASIDGMNEIAHYIRHPSNWPQIEKNLRIIDEMPDNTWLFFLYSVQALNIGHLPEFIRWVRAQNFKKEKMSYRTQMFVHPGIVHWPTYLNPKILPKSLKEQITKEFETLKAERDEAFDKFDGVVSFMNSEDWSNKTPLLVDYLKALDKNRGTDRFKAFPAIMESLDGR